VSAPKSPSANKAATIAIDSKVAAQLNANP
jgi:hypothetical protein